MTIAYVDDEPLPAVAVDELLADSAAMSPPDRRRLRRWLIHVLATARLLDNEARARRVEPADVSAPIPDPLLTGSITYAALRLSSHGRALYAWFAAEATVPPADVIGYYRRNLDRFPDQSIDEARADIERELRDAAAVRAFGGWLDVAFAQRVRLPAGSEHPSDPRVPDHGHHH